MMKMEAFQKWINKSPLIQVSNYLPDFDFSQPLVDTVAQSFEEDEVRVDLPTEIKHYICQFIGQDALRILAQVSSSWREICDDDQHWKRMFMEDKSKWMSFENPACVSRLSIGEMFSEMTVNITSNISSQVSIITSQVSSISSHVSNFFNNFTTPESSNHDNYNTKPYVPRKWKTRYLRQHMENYAPVEKASIFNSRMLSFTTKMYRVPLIGEGLDTTAKDLLYAMMWDKSNATGLSITGLYPGVDGIGSGVGFLVDGCSLNLAALHRCNLEQGKAQWKAYFQAVDAVVLVVNSGLPQKRNLDAKDEAVEIPVSNTDNSKLTAVLELVPAHVPLMVLLCVEEDYEKCLRPSELATKLELETRINTKHRCWCVTTVLMNTLQGVASSMKWLVRVL